MTDHSRRIGETTASWLERLIGEGAPADVRADVRQILASEQQTAPPADQLVELIHEMKETQHEMKETQHEMKEELHSLALRQHIMNEKLPKITEVFITPSEYKKSKHKETFLDLIEMFGFGRMNISIHVTEFKGVLPSRSEEFDFSFAWERQPERASYEPILKHLHKFGIDGVIVGEVQYLPEGILYHEELWTLKRNTLQRSEELRKTGEAPIFKYILRGRTDLVIKNQPDIPLSKSNNKYYIEIKRVEDFVEEDSLREAVLQLIGGNASNSFHSPPVLLTNLAKKHYVIYISLVGDQTVQIQYKLNVMSMPSFGAALAFVEEHTSVMKSVTLHLGRRPTPSSSPPKIKTILGSDDGEDFAERFDNNMKLDEVVTDQNGKAL